ncbi:hypothetical protein TGP89_362230 [Toxoplasma gondii p89]|uniref:Transmembrane protein n=3 Tax=Toxoplasma gondii TaxID=5811 RepID=A0A086L364_TOXGO|nr:hypothetical protein TGP89_362230 [Toxoplasma gondii p89]KFG51082.1 hypothetical protein TGFOU_362230 [Toxoplasma gondii FOU]PUA88858.1 hypothetical protein TGBR9_362230 [Toxoplasma gondii TgCATBr9]
MRWRFRERSGWSPHSPASSGIHLALSVLLPDCSALPLALGETNAHWTRKRPGGATGPGTPSEERAQESREGKHFSLDNADGKRSFLCSSRARSFCSQPSRRGRRRCGFAWPYRRRAAWRLPGVSASRLSVTLCLLLLLAKNCLPHGLDPPGLHCLLRSLGLWPASRSRSFHEPSRWRSRSVCLTVAAPRCLLICTHFLLSHSLVTLSFSRVAWFARRLREKKNALCSCAPSQLP